MSDWLTSLNLLIDVIDRTSEPSLRVTAVKALDAHLRTRVREIATLAVVAKELSGSIKSLPWHRSDGGMDAPYCLNHEVWKDWSCGEGQRLSQAVDNLLKK